MRKAKQKKDYLRLRIFVVLGFFILFFSGILLPIASVFLRFFLGMGF